MDLTTRSLVVDELLVALASGDALTVFATMARLDPTPTEVRAAEALVGLDEWFDFACGPWLAAHEG